MKHLDMGADSSWFSKDLLERFKRYTAVFTTSDSHQETCPSTPGQWDLARMLEAELKALGLSDVRTTEFCYVMARLPASPGLAARGTNPASVPSVGFLAHLDTASDTSGKDVKLQVHPNYDGGVLKLGAGITLDPADFPVLATQKGKTILTSDGTTLLGADDKAGVAEIMTALSWLVAHPDFPHGEIEVIFTPDEEIGRGVDKLDLAQLKSKICYTLDGEDEGSYNDACFSAWAVTAKFSGISMHPGYARGKLVNAISMLTMYLAAIPRTESPESTDGDFGFYSAQEVSGGLEHAEARFIIRDFDMAQVHRRVDFLKLLGKTVEAAFPGGKVDVHAREQYRNMKEKLSVQPAIIERLRHAIRQTGVEPFSENIRGGTDGSRLTEKGVLTPNIFAGGHNFHSIREWVALEAMERAAKVIINLAANWILKDVEFLEP